MYNFTEMKDFAMWLNEELNRQGWSNSELSRRSGMAHSTISMVISGQNKPGWDFCAGIAKAFGLPPETVFRIAGLLPAVPPEDATLKQLMDFAKGLNNDQREALLRYGQFRHREDWQEETPKRVTDTRAPYRTDPLPPDVTTTPDPEEITDLFERLDAYGRRTVYDLARWLAEEQQGRRDSTGRRPQKAEDRARLIAYLETLSLAERAALMQETQENRLRSLAAAVEQPRPVADESEPAEPAPRPDELANRHETL